MLIKQYAMRYPWLVALVALGAVAFGAIVWYLASPLFINQTISESLPTTKTGGTTSGVSGFKLLRTGVFHDADSFHKGSGDAKILQSADGQRVLRFENFKVINGPDLYVWLIKEKDATPSTDVLKSGYLDLGRLKGNIGDQNYEIPAQADLSQYNAVVIWCRNFSVLFAAAPLK